MKIECCLFLSILLVVGTATQGASEPSDKARRYHEMLVKRPQFGMVFDRFVEAWLEDSTMEELAGYLEQLAAKPDATAADYLVLGLMHVRQGAEAKALEAWGEGLRREPGNVAIWLEKAKLEVRLLDFGSALKSLDAASAGSKADAKQSVELDKLRGRILLRTGKPEDALKVWRELVTSHPTDEELAEVVIDLQTDEGLYAEAVDQAKALVERTRDAYAKASRQLRLAELLLRAGRRQEALDLYGVVLEQAGQGAWIEGEPLAQIEQLFRREDNISGLIDYLQGLALKHPQRLALQKQLARLHAENGSKDKALAIYKDLLDRTPGQKDLRESYLDLLERFEQYAEAIVQTKLLLEQHGGDRELRLRLAGLQQKAGDNKASDAELEAYLAAGGAAEFDHLRVARLLEGWGRKVEARAAYERMIKAFPESQSAREAQAQFLYGAGEKEVALTIWKELAAKGNEEQVLAVVQTLMARAESKVAYDLLKSRAAEFEKEPRYLAQLCLGALAAKDSKAAVPWALAWVKGSKNPELLDEAIRRSMDVLKDAEAIETTRTSLQALSELTMPERGLLAALQEAALDQEGAEKTLRQAPAADALEAKLRLVRLVEYRQDWLRAAEELKTLISLPEGKTSENLQRLVLLLQRSGNPEEALARVADWKTLSPGALQPWMTEAALLGQLNRVEEKLKALRAAARRFESDDTVTAALAEAYAESGNFAETERLYLGLYEKADDLDEKLRWVSALAQTAQARAMLTKVTENFQERQRTNRQDAAPWLALATIYQVANKQAERLKALHEALTLRPKDVKLLHQIASGEEDMGRWREAAATLDRAAPLDTTTRSRQLRAMLELRSGDEAVGQRLLMELMGGDKMEAKDAIRVADGMMANGNWGEAATFLKPFVEQSPTDYRLRYVYAVALTEDGRTEAATREFLQVAATKEELPEILKIKTPSKLNALRAYYDSMRGYYPPAVMEVSLITGLIYEARRYTFQRRYSRQSSGGSGVSVPSDREMATHYALLQLIYLHEEMTPPMRASLVAKVSESGFQHAELLLAFESAPAEPSSLSISDETVDARIHDSQFCGAWLISNAGRNRPGASDAERCAKVFETLSKAHPVLALQAAVQTVRSDVTKGVPLLERAMASLEGLDPAQRALTYYPLSELLGGGQQVNLAQRVELPEPLRKRMSAFLVAAARPDGDKNQAVYGEGNLVYASNALRAEADWSNFIRFWDERFAWEKDARSRKTMQGYKWRLQSGNQQRVELIKPLLFPPFGVAAPDVFVVMMHRADPWNPDIGEPQTGPQSEYALVAKLLDTVKDPTLRVLLAQKSGQDQVVQSMLEGRLKAEHPTLEDYLLAAGYAAYKGDHVKAAQALFCAMALPMDGAQRMTIDAAMVYECMTMNPNDRMAQPKEMLESGQQAARRLRSVKLDAAQREEVGSALVALGLKEEAEQWKKLTASATANVTVASNSGGTYYSRSQSASKLEKLLQQGNEEGALKAAAGELRSLQAQYWAHNRRYALQEAKPLVEKLNFKDAKARLIKEVAPTQGAGDSRILDGAALLQILGEVNAARDLYIGILEHNPKQEIARLQLLMIYAEQAPDKAVAMLSDMSWSMLAKSGTGNQIANMLRSGDGLSFVSKMALLEAVTGYMDKVIAAEHPPRGAFDWALTLPDAAGAYDNDARLPSLYRRGPLESNSSYRNAKAADLKRRRDVHDKLCQVMLKHAGTSTAGFRSLAGLAIEEGVKSDELAVVAHRVLEEQAKNKKSGVIFRAAPNSNSWSSQRSQEIWRPDPAEFLMWTSWKNGQLGDINSEILPLAEGCLDKLEMKTLRLRSELWTCAPENFGETARKFMKAVQPNSPTYGQPWLMDLMDCWRERKLPITQMDEQVLLAVKNSRDYDQPMWLANYVKYRSEQEGKVDSAFLMDIGEMYLGPKTGWTKRMTTYADQRYSNRGNMDDQKAYCLDYLITALLQIEQFESSMILAEATSLLKSESWRSSQLSSSMDVVAKTPGGVFSFLTGTPFLGGPADFSPLGQSASRNSSLLKSLTDQIKSHEDVRTAVLDSLKKRQPRTLGLDIFQALLEPDSGGALPAVLIAHAADLASLPKERHDEMAAFFGEVIAAVKSPDSMDAALRQVLMPIMAGQLQKQSERMDVLLTASSVAALKMRDSEFEAALPLWIGQVVQSDPARAEAVFLKAAQLMESKAGQQGWEGDRWTMGWTLRSELLDDFNDQCPGLPAMALAMRLCQSDPSGNLILDGKCNEGSWGKSLLDAWRRGGGAGSTAPTMTPLCNEVARQLNGTPSAFMALAWYEFFAKLPKGRLEEMLRWAEGECSKSPVQPVVRELAMAGRFFLATDSATQEDVNLQKVLADLGGVGPAWEHYRKHMQDEQLNPRVRIALASHLCSKDERTPDEEVVRMAARLCGEAHMALQATNGDFHYSVIMGPFSRLPVDERWKAEATKQWEAWLVRNARNGENENQNRAYVPRDSAGGAMLAVVSGLGEREKIDKVLRDSRKWLMDDPCAFVVLVSMGQHEAAEAWLKETANSLVYRADAYEFGPGIAGKAAEFGKVCKDGDLGLLGELLLVTLKDPPKWAQTADFVPQSKRLLALVPKFKAHQFASESVRVQCLERFGNEADILELLHDEYDAIRAKMDYAAAAGLKDTWKIWRRLKPVTAALGWHAKQGHNEIVRAEMEKLKSALPESNSYNLWTIGYALSDGFWGPVQDWEKGKMGDLAKFMELMTDFQTKLPRSKPDEGYTECDWMVHCGLTVQLIVHASKGDISLMKQATDRQSTADKAMFKRLMLQRSLFTETLARFVGKPKPLLPLDQRIDLVRNLFSNEFVASLYPATGSTSNLMQALSGPGKVFTAGEVAVAGRALAEVLPRNGRTAAEAADLAGAAGKASETPSLLDLAVSQSPPESPAIAGYLLVKAGWMERSGNKEQTKKLLDSIVVAKLDADGRLQHAAISKRL